MGDLANAPINEAVSLLDSLAPERLIELRAEHPELAVQLRVGVDCGQEDEVSPSLTRERARVLLAALNEAAVRAQRALENAAKRVARIRRKRLFSQVAVLIGSSSLLGAVALDQKVASVVSAVLTLLAALGDLLAQHEEGLLTPGQGTVQEIFQRLGEGRYAAHRMASELELSIRLEQSDDDLAKTIERGNALCADLNSWLIQLIDAQGAGASNGSSSVASDTRAVTVAAAP